MDEIILVWRVSLMAEEINKEGSKDMERSVPELFKNVGTLPGAVSSFCLLRVFILHPLY
ncbi:hypothetical protein MUN89_17445 [Halobacillus salinarum]|uniref:Uncharacterized protein n=1 Tax=Halobacillus salinarum TaxID=2932257 RepID=A0ABY4EIE8_9BACI|nr:hypothetical protein [Halobacillus salinarum]UOQ43653.1 hypothetical protein MUN89_17445 [Halobacillus salinarum]